MAGRNTEEIFASVGGSQESMLVILEEKVHFFLFFSVFFFSFFLSGKGADFFVRGINTNCHPCKSASVCSVLDSS